MSELISTLERINNHYGYGDIKHVDEKKGIVVISRPFMLDKVRRFSVEGDFVRFCGQKRSVGYNVR